MPLESVKMKNSKIGLRHVLSWPKVGLEPKFHESGTFGGLEKRGHTHRHTRFMFYKYRYKYRYTHRHTVVYIRFQLLFIVCLLYVTTADM